jgi:predicted DCC family thiol-disulfide oxidoreductase YuxK
VGGTVLFYDGVCGLCNRLLRFVMRRDRRGAIRFAPLQSAYAVETLARHGKDAARLDTVYVLVGGGAGERVLAQSRAILHVLRELGGGWRIFAAIVGVLPTVVLNVGYRFVARIRYRLFGKYEACQLPSPEERARFVAQSLPEG